MGFLEAFGQGFASFFSIWQVCILQITPFFLAYVTAVYFAVDGERGLGVRVILPSLFFAPGFASFYTLLALSGLPVGRILAFNLGTLGIFSGLYILLVSLTLLFAQRTQVAGVLRRPLVLAVASLLLGVSFALVYSPCITPALSDILNMTSRSETAIDGGVLAFFYSLGICLGLTISVTALVLVLKRSGTPTAKRDNAIRVFCGLVLAILGGLNITGLMVYYKAFFLGLLVQ